MTKFPLTVLLCALAWAHPGWTAASEDTPPAQSWRSLFNGEDLTGWNVIGDGHWEVENGEIVSHEGPSRDHSWLVSDDTFDNFVFHARFKWERGNSGIQFRTHREGDKLAGYQADLDMDSDWITGHVYELEGRGSIAKAPERFAEQLPKNEWIDYEIVCASDRIQLFLNGVRSVDFEDSAYSAGHFAFQVHAGDGCAVRWKDMRVLELNPGQDFEPFFEGDDIENGWRIVGEEKFTAKDGVVTGETVKGGYGWLVTDREYKDFVMTFRYRWTHGNSGVQFRSWLVGDEMHGYQADIDPSIPHMTGAIYDEHERASLVMAVPEIDEGLDKDAWHNYEISALGDDLRIYHDGVLASQFKEDLPERIRKGIFALQVHSIPKGQKVEMQWKDLRILNLAPPSPWE